MNVLSLFDGMSCGRVALDRLGYNVDDYFASEIDTHAIKVAKVNYPNTIHLGDVVKIDGYTLPKIDLLIGGSPCQGFSFAGKQLNFEDPRSKLFFEFIRLLNETNPKYFMLENVNMKQEYQDIISNELGVKPIKINSNLISAQNRTRLYWTNIQNISQPEDKNILLKDIIEDGFVDKAKSYCIDASYSRNANPYSYIKKSRGTLVFKDLESIKYFRSLTREDLLSEEIINLRDNMTYRKLTPLECERLQTLPDNYTNHVSNNQRYKMIGNGWTVDVICHILKNMN